MVNISSSASKIPNCIRQAGAAVRVTVHAKPNARVSAVTGWDDEALGVAVAAPPTEGLANVALCEYLAQILSVRPRRVALDRGSRSRHKVVVVEDTEASAVWEFIQAARHDP